MADYLGYDRAFQQFNIRYEWEPGAKQRGHGDMSGLRYIVEHHTAGGGDTGDIRIVRDGRAGLLGPLSQLVLKRDGSVRIIAVGVCYHAPSSINFRGVAPGSGNWWSIGIEGVSNGYNDWTPEQRESYPRVVAALLWESGLPRDAHIFHRDLQPGEKIDPGGFEKGWFQRMVDAALAGGGAPVKTAIQHHREQNPWLGNKTIPEDERPTADGVGRWAAYEGGHIYWHPAFGVHAVPSRIFGRYSELRWETGELGYPISDPQELEGGVCQAFQGGMLYFVNGIEKAFVVKGAIGNRWWELQRERGPLGYPLSDEITFETGIFQVYQGGHMYFGPATGAREIPGGPMWDEFERLGREKALGLPTGSPSPTLDGRGTVQSFEKGGLYRLGARDDAHALTGVLFELYGKLGYENGRFGMPISDVYTKPDTTIERADFEAGSIEHDTATGDVWMVLSGKRVPVTPPPPPAPAVTVVSAVDGKAVVLPLPIEGRVSWFAGPNDLSTLNGSMALSGEPGRLPVDPWYCAMRWSYCDWEPYDVKGSVWLRPVAGTSNPERKKALAGLRILVTHKGTGKQVVLRAADTGPRPNDRVVDISPHALHDVLGGDTGDEVRVELAPAGAPLGPYGTK